MNVAYDKLRFPGITEIRIQRMLRLLRTGEPVENPWFIPNAMLPIFCKPARYRICYGGRGAGRSWAFARVLLLKALERKLHILCAREFQNSIEESIHQLLSNQIEELGWSSLFEIKKREIVANNGSDFVFAGLRTNITKLQSFEGADICYIEEAAKISKDSWEKLKPTIRRTGSEIWGAFNPDLENDETYKLMVTNPPKEAEQVVAIVKTTFRDNPWFPEPLRQEMEYLRRVDIDAYTHVWEGECRKNSAAQILRNKYVVEAFVAGKDWMGPYYGVDWGFSQDPSVMIRCWIHGMKLYIDFEAYKIGCDTDRLPQLFDEVPGGRTHVSRADCARPETISALQKNGYPQMVACDKWSGSVEDGVAHLRSYEQIVIHPRCEHTIEEAKLYSYKTDRISKDVLTEIVDKHNHCMDAIRYALGPMIKQGGAESFLAYMKDQNAKTAVQTAEAQKTDMNITSFINLMGATRK
jgi:phage terminase large subunit